MAVIAPFRGLRYNEQKVGEFFNFEDVITPPYDVITLEEREDYRQKSPYNFVHIDLPIKNENCASPEAPYEQSRRLLLDWVSKGIFRQDEHPCFYYYELDYPLPSSKSVYTRKGFFTLLKLEEFRKGCVYPHERTFSKVKEDRLLLTTYCEAHLSPIFALYSDRENIIEKVGDAVKGQSIPPLIDYEDNHSMTHRVWRIEDPSLCNFLVASFADKDIFIADGHHRYETALAYRDKRRTEAGRKDDNEPYEFALMYLSPMEDQGLVILPTHRLFPEFPQKDPDVFLKRCEEFFIVDTFSFSRPGWEELFKAMIKEALQGASAFAFAVHGHEKTFLLRSRKERVFKFLEDAGVVETFWDIDVVVLDKLIFNHLVSLNGGILEDEKRICFSHDGVKAFEEIQKGKYQAGFIINPTRIDQVKRVASQCLVMPHKSTYFYPKVVSGLVMHWMPGAATLSSLGMSG